MISIVFANGLVMTDISGLEVPVSDSGVLCETGDEQDLQFGIDAPRGVCDLTSVQAVRRSDVGDEMTITVSTSPRSTDAASGVSSPESSPTNRGKIERHSLAFSDLRVDPDLAAGLADEAVDHGKAETGTLALTCKALPDSYRPALAG